MLLFEVELRLFGLVVPLVDLGGELVETFATLHERDAQFFAGLDLVVGHFCGGFVLFLLLICIALT